MGTQDKNMSNETIAAIATPLGSGGIGIVRVSGPEAEAVLSRLLSGAVSVDEMESHRLYLGEVKDAEGALLDRALAVIMRAPRSYILPGHRWASPHASLSSQQYEILLNSLTPCS